MSNISFAAYLSLTGEAKADADFLCAIRGAGFSFCVCNIPMAADAAVLREQLSCAGLRIIAIELDGADALPDMRQGEALADSLGVPDLLITVGAELPDKLDLSKISAHFRALLKVTTITTLPHFLRDTSLSEAAFALDTFALQMVGNPADTIRALPDRCPLLLLQDADTESGLPCAIGEGALDWAEIFDAAEEAAVEWYLCPVENSPPALERARRSLSYLIENA